MEIYSRLKLNGRIEGYRIFHRGEFFDIDHEIYALLIYELGNIKSSDRIELLVDKGNYYITESELRGLVNPKTVDKSNINILLDHFNSDVDLKLLHRKFNSMYFNSNLESRIDINYNYRMTKDAGYFEVDLRKGFKRIEISAHYIRKYDFELENVLIHEMIHQLIYERGLTEAHGYFFKSMMGLINSEGMHNVKIYSLGRGTPKRGNIALRCVECNKVYRKQRMKYSVSRYTCRCIKRGTLEIIYDSEIPFYYIYYCGQCNEFYFSDAIDGEESTECPECYEELVEV